MFPRRPGSLDSFLSLSVSATTGVSKTPFQGRDFRPGNHWTVSCPVLSTGSPPCPPPARPRPPPRPVVPGETRGPSVLPTDGGSVARVRTRVPTGYLVEGVETAPTRN